MPTKERKEREKEQRAHTQAMDAYVADAPTHIRQRLGHPSKLSDNLSTKGQHDAGWSKYDDETGHPLPREDPEGLGANLERNENMVARALDMREKHRDVWGKRGVAKRIAYKEELSVETVRRYMRKFPI